ncbi:MAG: VWA domain-containing protein [Haloarculaceae archaeon]
MNDDDPQLYNLSRRKVLGGLGAIGLASAGAGLGTSAYFTDTELFTDNAITAGTLDLKLDYKATYDGGPGRLSDLEEFYPDAQDLGDGVYLLDQTPRPGSNEAWEEFLAEYGYCGEGSDDYLVNGDGIPVFNLQDVKPGDSGEVTISLHLCDNPAWLEMNGELVENLENGVVEPEADVDPNGDDSGELADAIEVTVWYDEDCDNVFEPTTGEQGELEVALVSDVSGSMSGSKIAALKTAAKGFVDNLTTPDEAAAVSFSSGATVDQGLTTNYSAVKSAIDGYSAGGSTNIASGIQSGQTELVSGTNATAGASKVMILLSDGNADSDSAAQSAATAAKNAGIRVFTIALGGDADTSLLSQLASSPGDAYVAPSPGDLANIYTQIAQVVLAGETAILSGSLANVMSTLAEGIALDGDRTQEGRQPYPAATTQCIGFSWELPATVGNEIQSDSVAFDVGFTAVQSRHNPTGATSP